MAKKRIPNKEYLELWNEFCENMDAATPIDLTESPMAKLRRIQKLEADDEAWFAYYFPKFYTSEPADFHKKSTKKIINKSEYFVVRSWARELSKSGRTMMEVLKLVLTDKKKNVLLVSSSLDNAERLLLPYKAILERNNRIINDYGEQRKIGSWTSTEFKTRKGVAFRALGVGQSPRGTRNDNFRPDIILIDDIDTDEKCRNPQLVEQDVKWINEALIPTRSISNGLLIIACGNIIANYCCITELGTKADDWEVINIRDAQGKSTWPQKNSEADIDRALKIISYEAQQKEYYNNPMDGGNTFKELADGKCPQLRHCDYVVIYGDPSPSNSESKNSSNKAVVVVSKKGTDFHIQKVWLNTMTNATFCQYLFEAYLLCKNAGVEPVILYIENNTLQNPFYEQVLLPLIYEYNKQYKVALPVRPDERKKPDKYTRIEGKLEPINRLGHLIFNEKESTNPHMMRLKSQFKNFNPKAKLMDGPDAVEGAVVIIENQEITKAVGGIELVQRTASKHRI